MKDVLGLYVKTYMGDYSRFRVLLESIERYNVEKIPLYVDVTAKDYKAFSALIDSRYTGPHLVLKSTREESSLNQQVNKLEFYQTGLCENIVVLDSDSYFIRDFRGQDFMATAEVPYTVMHEEREFFSWLSQNPGKVSWNVPMWFNSHCVKAKEYFGLEKEMLNWSFGPPPVILSGKVLKAFREFLGEKPFEDLIAITPSEYTWYGYFLVKSQAIGVSPREPLFKFFHYKEQYEDFKSRGVTEEMLAQDYMGIVMQSNWKAPLRY
jgi:hypothetical protein